jgi:hypothetical protein
VDTVRECSGLTGGTNPNSVEQVAMKSRASGIAPRPGSTRMSRHAKTACMAGTITGSRIAPWMLRPNGPRFLPYRVR